MLGRRGCSRTALEYCKLVLSLDPSDPFAVHLVIDFYALRAKESAYVLRFAREHKKEGTFSYSLRCLLNCWHHVFCLKGRPSAKPNAKNEFTFGFEPIGNLPNFAYSISLAQFNLENEAQQGSTEVGF